MTKYPLRIIYLISFLVTLQGAFAAYITSSFLGGFFGENHVGIIYAASSILSILALSQIPKLLERIGNYKTTIIILVSLIFSVLMLGRALNPIFVFIFFLLYIISSYLFFFAKDIFIEDYSKNTSTGLTRGTYLTILNMAWLLAPFASGFVAAKYGYGNLFTFGLIALLPAIILFVYGFKGFKDPSYKKISLKQAFTATLNNKDIFSIYIINFILQFFYAWMTIYMPIYLHKYIGLTWDKIGIILSFTLLPFVLIQYPLGKLSDRIGEKEMLSIGFIFITLSTGLIYFINDGSMFLWSAILLLTRIGAAMIEVLCETYFFKKVGPEDAEIISFYRNAFPLSYVIAPLIATVLLYFAPMKALFMILAVFMLIGFKFIRQLKDTA